MNTLLLIAMLPIVFMLHDLEEIIFFQPWLEKNRKDFFKRFPRLAKMIYANYANLSTSSYAVAILHVFVAISVCTFLSFYFSSYGLWFGAFIVFFLHLLVHVVQWVIWGRYVPFIVTSILALPYCIYTFTNFLKVTEMDFIEIILWVLAAALALIPLFPLAFFNARKFEAWKRKTFGY